MPGCDVPCELKCTEDDERRDGHDQDAPVSHEDPHREGEHGADPDRGDAVPQVIEWPWEVGRKIDCRERRAPQ